MRVPLFCVLLCVRSKKKSVRCEFLCFCILLCVRSKKESARNGLPFDCCVIALRIKAWGYALSISALSLVPRALILYALICS